MQSEDRGTEIRFDAIRDFLSAKSKNHVCGRSDCSIQVRWTLTLEECCNPRGRSFCRKLSILGLHPFANVDLVQRSVGWIEGFSAPYFMCRMEGTFVGHTEQGGTAAHAILLSEKNSASLMWESSYIPAGKMVNDLKSFTQSRAAVFVEDAESDMMDGDYYPGPLLWWDDKEGELILEGLGLLIYFGRTAVQNPGDLVLTSCSRLIDDAGLFVQYHQTKTVPPKDGCKEPLVLFAQNLAPLDNSTWCSDVMPRVACSNSPADSVMQCWGLGFLLFCHAHPENVADASANVFLAAQASLVREVLVPSLRQLSVVGKLFKKSVVLHPRMDAFVFPFDLYTRDFSASASRIQVFCQCVCELCNMVIPGLLFAHKGTFMCLACSEMKANGVVWELKQIVSLLNPPRAEHFATMSLRSFSELSQTHGLRFAEQVYGVWDSEAFKEAQVILEGMFPFNSAGELVSQIALEVNFRVTICPLLPCLDNVDTNLKNLFVDDKVPRLVRDGYQPSFVVLGHLLHGCAAKVQESSNCQIVFSDGFAHLIVSRPIEKGERLQILIGEK